MTTDTSTVRRAPPPPPPPPPPRPKSDVHVMKKGETVDDVAQSSGVSAASIAKANPQHFDATGNAVHDLAGTELKIPARAPESADNAVTQPLPYDPKTVNADTKAAKRLLANASTDGLGDRTRPNPFADSDVTNTGVRAARGMDPAQAAAAKKQMQSLLETAKADSTGKQPDGWCLSHVQDYLDQTAYGSGKVPRVPEAHDYADFLNKDGNAEKLGLQKLDIKNPYDAPPGSIVVVAAGSPGTSDPTAGDITVKGEGDAFYNGGEMGYGAKADFEANGGKVLGVYVPKGGAGKAATTASPTVTGHDAGPADAATTADDGKSIVPPALKRGDRNEDVKDLQKALKTRGIDPGPLDGIYGPRTEAAVKKFNESQGIEGGNATNATQAALHPQAAARDAAAEDRVHTVEPGERVDDIAKDNNVSVALLRQANPMLDKQTSLTAGQKLFIPGVDLKAAPEAAYDAAAAAKDPTSTMGALPENAMNLGINPADYQRAPGAVPPATAGIKAPEGKDRMRLQGLQQGDEGERVTQLQRALEKRGYEVEQSGKFDKKTAHAVAQFHTDNGLDGGNVATVTDQRALFAQGFLYGKDAVVDKSTAPMGDVTLPPEPGAPFGRVDLSTPEGRAVFAEGAKLAGLPPEWANSQALASLVNAESGGIVGRPNYTYGSRAQDPSQWGAIHDELKRGQITAASSATGLGQLLSSNVAHYYPAGLKGIGDPVQEAAGMLKYIKERYGTPEIAWGNHSANPRRHQGVPVIYTSEGY